MVIIEHKGDLHPQIVIEDERGQPAGPVPDPREGAHRGQGRRRRSRPAPCSRRRRERCTGTQDITGGLPRVTEIFEARKPKDPAIMARSTAGRARPEKRRGKRTIIVQNETGTRRSTSSRTASTCACTPATLSGRAIPGRGAARAARHPADQGRGGAPRIPARRGPERLPRPGRDDRRQAHRDHRRPDAAQGPRREPGDSDFLPGRVVDKFQFRRRTSGSSSRRASRRRRSPSFWASPRRPCRAIPSSRPPPSRKPPRC
jgi:DNA-directed RNA polymerase subunit beta'